jgi:hypothetical protein
MRVGAADKRQKKQSIYVCACVGVYYCAAGVAKIRFFKLVRRSGEEREGEKWAVNPQNSKRDVETVLW